MSLMSGKVQLLGAGSTMMRSPGEIAGCALAIVSPYVTLAICAALAVFYAFPIGSGGTAGGT